MPTPFRGGEKECEQCGARYRVSPSRMAKSRYCTIECRNAHDRTAPRRKLVCEECGETFESPADHGAWPRFCSRACFLGACIQPEEKPCQYCGTMFLAGASSHDVGGDGRKLFCSHQCANARLKNGDEKICVECGATFYVSANRKDSQLCCSERCRVKYYTEERSSGWKGGEYETGGQRFVRLPRQDRASPYTGEHRLVATKALGRLLDSWEIVIRIDREPDNNRPENLFICASMSEYAKRRNGSLPWPHESNLGTYADRLTPVHAATWDVNKALDEIDAFLVAATTTTS